MPSTLRCASSVNSERGIGDRPSISSPSTLTTDTPAPVCSASSAAASATQGSSTPAFAATTMRCIAFPHLFACGRSPIPRASAVLTHRPVSFSRHRPGTASGAWTGRARTLQRTEGAECRCGGSEAPGEFFCSLMFRVGLADETLATHGITHLVEHLALFALGRRDHAYNGFVDDTRCVFYASGERDEVLEYLRLGAAALQRPAGRPARSRAPRAARGGLRARRAVHAAARPPLRRAPATGSSTTTSSGCAGSARTRSSGLGARRASRAATPSLWMTGEPPEELGPRASRRPRDHPGRARRRSRCSTPHTSPRAPAAPCSPASAARSTPLRAAWRAAGERLYDQRAARARDGVRAVGRLRGARRGLAHVALGVGLLERRRRRSCSRSSGGRRSELAEDGATEEELERYRRGALRSLRSSTRRSAGGLDVRAADDLLGARAVRRGALDGGARSALTRRGGRPPRSARSSQTAILLGPDGGGGATRPAFCAGHAGASRRRSAGDSVLRPPTAARPRRSTFGDRGMHRTAGAATALRRDDRVGALRRGRAAAGRLADAPARRTTAAG